MNSDSSLLFATLLFPALGIIAASILITIVIINRKQATRDKSHKIRLLTIFAKVFAGVLLTAVIGFIVFNVIPEQIHNKSWAAKQESCAKQAGFDNVLEANSSSDFRAVNYQQCLR